MREKSIVIAGAGIGGLTAALTLHGQGFDVRVIERAHRIEALGVGINLLPHAVRELHILGLADPLATISVAPSAISYFDSRGTHLFREPRGIEGGYGYPQLSVHRGRLQEMLLATVTERLGADAVRTAAGLIGFTQGAEGVSVHTAAGDLRADILVGADGVNSVVRRLLHPGEGPLQWSGVRMFRGVTRQRAFLDGATMVIIKGDNGIELVAYPIGDGLLNWVLQVTVGEPGPLTDDVGWNRRADATVVASLTDDWRLEWLDVPAMVRTASAVFEYPMVDRDPLPRWGTGRITLLGDGAHPMYPVGANGGSQAIIDARVLADEIGRDIDGGLRRYEAIRIRDTADVVAANREMFRATAQDSASLARITAKYRTDTKARRRHA